MIERLPVDAFLADFPDGIRESAEVLRAIVLRAVPHAVERVRIGWRLIGYDMPLGRGSRYFAWVAPETAHVHLGFQYGAWMPDPDRRLRGAHLKLRKVRYVTFTPGQAIPRAVLIELTREAARTAALSTAERMARVLDDGWRPARSGC